MLDGDVVAEARIDATDEGLLRGDGVFEVLRVYRGRPFAFAEHLARLERSAENLRLPLDVAAVRSDAETALGAAGPVEALLRLVVTRGGRRLAFVEPLPDYPETATLGFVTFAPPRILDGIKSLSYAGNMLASRLAAERGFDEALLVTPHGRVLEGPTSSFFYVRDGELFTPPLSDHVLASITRANVIELTGAHERSLGVDEVGELEEAFLASTVREVMPVTAIEDRELPAPWPCTLAAREALRAHIEASLST